MSTDFLETGRVAQKQRTHDALVEATRELLARGVTPTVEDAAELARVSRTTAYRYFPNQAALLAAAHPEIEMTSLLTDTTEDPVARIDQLVDAIMALTVDTEREQRATLRLSLELEPAERSRLPLRQGRSIGWICEALEPMAATHDRATIEALAMAVRSATGIESLVWLTDVAGLDRAQARDLMRWSARVMTRAALMGEPPPHP